jgi:hypothetical protein
MMTAFGCLQVNGGPSPGDIPEHLHEGHGIECRAIGSDTTKSQVACRQGHFQTPQKRSDIVMRGIVI